MCDIVALGAAVMDVVQRVERFPRPGETVSARSCNIALGGQAPNQAIAAARLGCKAAVVTTLCTDTYGDNTIDLLKKENIDTSCIARTADEPTSFAMIMVDDSGQNMICCRVGTMLVTTRNLIDNAGDLLKSAKIALVQLELPLPVAEVALLAAREHKLFTILNLSPASPSLPQYIYAMADLCCPNETEAEVLLGIAVVDLPSAEAAAQRLLLNGCRYPVITLGEKGCVWLEKLHDGTTHFHHVKAPVVKAVDTTGAGDAFIGSLAAYLLPYLEDLTTARFLAALNFACRYAALSVQGSGTNSSYPRLAQLPTELLEMFIT